jgi:hypothetical protein
MIRFTDYDRRFGPVIFGRTDTPYLRFVWSSGDEETSGVGNHVTLRVGKLVFVLLLPPILRHWRRKVVAASWDAATVERLGRNWYWDQYPRELGFSLLDGHLSIYYGVQTHNSETTKQWGWFLPWTQWRHVRHSLYDTEGKHYWTEPKERTSWEDKQTTIGRCPTQRFLIEDYDGQQVIAITKIEEREWFFGDGWFRWLSWFRKPLVRRSLDIAFNDEVGKGKGSWKGGTIGTGIDMLPNELHEAAMRRFCEKEHRSKNGKYKLTFVEVLP